MSDILLIANSNSSHNIRRVVNELNEINWNSITEPWGQSETLACGEEFFIRKIKVKPEKNIAIQPGHNHGQHWIIISGVAQVTNGSMIDIYKKNDYFFVHLHEAYSIANHSLGYLELIEVYTMRKHDAKKVT
jgi:mannose-6-phosphate isomerase-like protein (cupin superfamily)